MRSQGKPGAVVQGQFDDADPGYDGGPSTDAGMMLAQGGALQRVQTQFSSAVVVQKPRDRKKIQAAVLEEAELVGEGFFYAWSTSNKDGTKGLVEGISIEGAMILARNYGNCAIPTELVVDAPQHWIISATFVDLETGFNVPRLFRQRKGQRSGGKMDADRAMDIAFQIGQSKAQRNAIDKAMPAWLKDAALSKAKAAAEGKFKDIPEANKRAINGFAKWNVTQQMLEEKLGLKVEHWTAQDHVSLSGLYRAIKDRQTTVAEEFFSKSEDDGTAADNQQAQQASDNSYGGSAEPAAASGAAASGGTGATGDGQQSPPADPKASKPEAKPESKDPKKA
jgi:hypothetical protein